VDIVFNNTFPNEGTVEDMVPELEEEFVEQFDARVESVREKVFSADDPFQEIMDMDL